MEHLLQAGTEMYAQSHPLCSIKRRVVLFAEVVILKSSQSACSKIQLNSDDSAGFCFSSQAPRTPVLMICSEIKMSCISSVCTACTSVQLTVFIIHHHSSQMVTSHCRCMLRIMLKGIMVQDIHNTSLKYLGNAVSTQSGSPRRCTLKTLKQLNKQLILFTMIQ